MLWLGAIDSAGCNLFEVLSTLFVLSLADFAFGRRTREAEIQDGACLAKNVNSVGSGNLKNVRPAILRKEIVKKTE